jgi:DNA-binding LacI/PurR family transcriptional regulator
MRKRPSKVLLGMSHPGRGSGLSRLALSTTIVDTPVIAPAKREAIVRLARQSGTTTDSRAQTWRAGRPERTLSVVVAADPERPLDPGLEPMFGCLANEIIRHDYRMVLQRVSPRGESWLDDLVESTDSEGIVVLCRSREHGVLQKVARSYHPLVAWGVQRVNASYCSVGTGHEAGARAAVEHLLQSGRRRIIFVGSIGSAHPRLRYEAYRRALREASGHAAPPRIVSSTLAPSSVYQAVSAAVREGRAFDAVLAVDDVVAVSTILALNAAGLSVPDDVAVIGFGNSPIAAHCSPPLTTLRRDLEHEARTLIELLLRRLKGERTRSVTLPTKLVVRESSAPRQDKRGQLAAFESRAS